MRLPPSVRGSLPTELQPIQKSKTKPLWQESTRFAQFCYGFRRADVLCPIPAQAQPVEDGPTHSGIPTVDWDAVMRDTSSDSSSSSSSSVWSDPCSFVTHVAVGPSRIHGCGLIATMDIEYAALGGKQSWDDLTSGTVLVLTLPIPDQIAAEHYCSFMEKNHVPDPAIFLPSLGGRVVPLCVSRRGKISKSPLWYMNSSSSPATANATVLHKVVGDECKIVVEVRRTVLKGQELTWFYGGRWLQQ